MPNLRIVLVLLAGLIAAATAAADPLIAAGNHRIALDLSPDIQGPSGDTIRIGIGYGRFVHANGLLHANFEHAVTEDIATEDSDYKSQAYGAAYTRYFPISARWVPFAGVHVGYRTTRFAGESESGLVYGVDLGTAYFVAENVSLDLGIEYRGSSADVFLVDFERDSVYLTPRIGFRVYI